MGPVPLQLALYPVLPLRVPEGDRRRIGYGFRLRLPDGPALAGDDPLLSAFGAEVVRITGVHEHRESLQHEGFTPGRRLTLLPEPFVLHDPDAIGVWDAEGIRQAGVLPEAAAARVSAALDHGLAVEALALWEERCVLEGTRESLRVLVHAPALVSVAQAPGTAVLRPHDRTAPRRLVLFADGSADVRWWDPTAAGGPVGFDELPLPPELVQELERLRDGYAGVRRSDDAIEALWDREQLDEAAVDVWRRVRAHLGRRYRVGYLGPGMRRPAWSPDELDDDEDDGMEGMFADAAA